MSSEFVARKGLIALQTSSFKEDVYISGSLRVGTSAASSKFTVSGSAYISKGLVVHDSIYSPQLTASAMLFSGSTSNIRLVVSSSGDVSFYGDSEGNLLTLSDAVSYGNVMSVGSFVSSPVFQVTSADLVILGNYNKPAITVYQTGAPQYGFAIMTGSLNGTASFASSTSFLIDRNKYPVSIITASYTVDPSDYALIGNHASTPFTITLLSAPSHTGRSFIIKNKGAATVTVDATALGQIDGINTYILNQYQSVTVLSDGSTWNVL